MITYQYPLLVYMFVSLPLKNLAISQQVKGPELVYWPRDNSKKKIGIPTKNNMITYGMKNTAGKKTMTSF